MPDSPMNTIPWHSRRRVVPALIIAFAVSAIMAVVLQLVIHLWDLPLLDDGGTPLLGGHWAGTCLGLFIIFTAALLLIGVDQAWRAGIVWLVSLAGFYISSMVTWLILAISIDGWSAELLDGTFTFTLLLFMLSLYPMLYGFILITLLIGAIVLARKIIPAPTRSAKSRFPDGSDEDVEDQYQEK